MSLLNIDNLHIGFEGVDAVRGLSLSIKPGETLALVGESGSGKSVTALSVLQLLDAAASRQRGSIRFDGKELLGADEKTLRTVRGNDISMIFQEPMTALNPLHSIGKQIAEPLRLHQSLTAKQEAERITALLEMVGLEGMRDRLHAYPHQLSGGERQRVMIAMAMANQPKLLIADEPTTALDVTLQRHILRLLKKLQQEQSLSLLFITHDLTLVRKMADRVAVMREGEIVETGTVKDVFASPQHYYTQSLLSAAPKGGPEPISANAATVLETTDLTVTYGQQRRWYRPNTREKTALNHFACTLAEGETLGIVGESGSGKTSLALALLRLIPSSGPIVFAGTRLDTATRKQLHALRSDMQMVFQDPFGSLNPRMSVGDIIGEGLRVHAPTLSRKEREERITTALEQVGLEADMRHRYPHAFSGGQRQRIAIARAMILRPKLVILDEPTSALDLTLQGQIVELLQDFQLAHKTAYLFISHDLRVIRAMAHRIMVLQNGEIVEQGTAEKLFDQPQKAYTQALMHAAFDADL